MTWFTAGKTTGNQTDHVPLKKKNRDDVRTFTKENIEEKLGRQK